MERFHIGDDVNQIRSDRSMSEAEKKKELMALFQKEETAETQESVGKVCFSNCMVCENDSIADSDFDEKEELSVCCSHQSMRPPRVSRSSEEFFDTPEISKAAEKPKRRRLLRPIYILVGLCVVIVSYLIISYNLRTEDSQLVTTSIQGDKAYVKSAQSESKGYVSVTNKEVGGEEFVIMEPCNAKPELAVGYDNVKDSDIVAIFEAAGISGDSEENGEHSIVGVFVCKGELLSRGKSKLGFCAIVDDKITLGVADNTPLFEKCVESEGYFFRQYPLVASGEVVELKPLGSNYRKALAELDGKIVVIQSKSKMTFGDFSEALKVMGVTTAIYLNGGEAISKYLNQDGTYAVLGNDARVEEKNVNYIVWRQK